MNPYRVAQVLLLLAALVIGVSTPAFNGLSLLALLLAGSTLVIEKHRTARVAAPATTETTEEAAA
ncbi:hypothetical protein ASH00_14485 [Arthrobacter sp. Soil782]|uniref:hypothetical protein n=1 Tax=Arthrobacter sp. Soil782 TaxID=1736410 RepID=UPI0006F9741D|nr:hypothetical protein [Arthrobacter sp. Soil782]KRF04309.1 hypothetical protein ASH00_14485 [Arthrobacter sp. Soil782]